MKIGYRIYTRENSTTGKVKYGVRLVPYSTIDEESIVKLAQADSNINTQDLAAGFAALTQAIHDFVLNGHSVTLNGLGNFRLTCKTGEWDEETQKWKSAGKNSMDDVSSDAIKGVYVRFRPCTSLRNQLACASYFDVSKKVFGKKWSDTASDSGSGTEGGSIVAPTPQPGSGSNTPSPSNPTTDSDPDSGDGGE